MLQEKSRYTRIERAQRIGTIGLHLLHALDCGAEIRIEVLNCSEIREAETRLEFQSLSRKGRTLVGFTLVDPSCGWMRLD